MRNRPASVPGGKQGRPVKNKRDELKSFFYSPERCGACPFKDRCVKSKRGYRVISLKPREKELQKARTEENTTEFKACYNATRHYCLFLAGFAFSYIFFVTGGHQP